MIKSTINSIVKLPLQIPSETSVRLRKEAETKKVSIVKPAPKKEAVEQIHGTDDELRQLETPSYSNGYIKYPRYDFF